MTHDTTFDLFKHELVPKHILLTKEEIEELCEKYQIKPFQLPRIKVSDPAAIAVGAKAGDVIKIVRKSSTAGEVIVYRYVIGE
jgi:DNA-directed RNA polymerase subunit H (RpoH/RPB5)